MLSEKKVIGENEKFTIWEFAIFRFLLRGVGLCECYLCVKFQPHGVLDFDRIEITFAFHS